MTIVFPNTLRRSAKQEKDNILPAFSHMADNKTYTPLLQDVHTNVVHMNFFLSVQIPFFSGFLLFFFLPSFFLFFFLKHCPFQNKGRFSIVPVPQSSSGVTSLWQLLPRAGMQSSCNCATPYCWCMSIRTYELRKICSVHSVK